MLFDCSNNLNINVGTLMNFLFIRDKLPQISDGGGETAVVQFLDNRCRFLDPFPGHKAGSAKRLSVFSEKPFQGFVCRYIVKKITQQPLEHIHPLSAGISAFQKRGYSGINGKYQEILKLISKTFDDQKPVTFPGSQNCQKPGPDIITFIHRGDSL